MIGASAAATIAAAASGGGGGPTPPVQVLVTVRPAGQGGDYTRIVDALAGETPLPANTYLVVEVQGDWSAASDTGDVNVTTIALGAGLYIEIRADSANAFNGVVDMNKYVFGGQMEVRATDVRIRGIQANHAVGCFSVHDSAVALFDRCAAFGAGFYGFRANDSGTFTATNCLVYDITTERGFVSFSTVSPQLLFCTAVSCAVQCFRGCVVYNCLGALSSADVFGDCSGDNNASDDGSAPGAASIHGAAFSFVNEADDNYLLSVTDFSGAAQGGAVTDPPVTTDVTGAPRATPPSIGFSQPKDQVTSAEANGSLSFIREGNTAWPSAAFTITYRGRFLDWASATEVHTLLYARFGIDAGTNEAVIYAQTTADELRLYSFFIGEVPFFTGGPTDWLDIVISWDGDPGHQISVSVAVNGGTPVVYAITHDILHTLQVFNNRYAEQAGPARGCTLTVWDGLLSPSETLEQLGSDVPIDASAGSGAVLWSWYPMNTAATAHLDASGNGRHMTPTGTGLTVVDVPY